MNLSPPIPILKETHDTFNRIVWAAINKNKNIQKCPILSESLNRTLLQRRMWVGLMKTIKERRLWLSLMKQIKQRK